MSDEIRRRKTQDPEMDAILVINQALEPLDRPAAKRVLAWADERYVNPVDPVPMGSINKFMEALATTATEIHVSPPAKLLDAMAMVVQEMRDQRKLEASEAA